MTTNNERFAMTTIEHGKDALHSLTNVIFLRDILIAERTGGYDCDNAGRAYVNENYTTYEDLVWSVMNHISFYGYEHVTCIIEGDVDFHSEGSKWREIRFQLPPDDPESFGYVYTITHKPELDH